MKDNTIEKKNYGKVGESKKGEKLTKEEYSKKARKKGNGCFCFCFLIAYCLRAAWLTVRRFISEKLPTNRLGQKGAEAFFTMLAH
jgi:hypothetical protein